MNKLIRLLPAAASMLILLSSCNHKDLYIMESYTVKVRVAYDWRQAPDASPKGMCAFFYSVDEPARYRRFDFPNATGGYIELPAGKYRIISYNNDTETVQFSSTDNYAGHTAFTRTGDILEPLYGSGISSSASTDNGERVVIVPDNLWGCSVQEVEVSQSGSWHTFREFDARSAADGEADSVQTITLPPHDMLCHYSYEVRNVKNIERLSRVSGTLSGMASKMNMVTEDLDPEPVTLAVSGRPDVASRKIRGEFLTFGYNAATNARHRMSFYVVMDNGSKYTLRNTPNLDVTEQVDTVSNRRRVHIIIDGLELPDTSQSAEDFDPTVDDWGIIEQDINI